LRRMNEPVKAPRGKNRIRSRKKERCNRLNAGPGRNVVRIGRTKREFSMGHGFSKGEKGRSGGGQCTPCSRELVDAETPIHQTLIG